MQRIGKYEILEQIGAGGFGIVFKGRDPLIERLVAVKTCNSDDEELRHRFVREARTAGRLQHRNITTVYDFGYHEGVPYLVQEYLTGEDLDRILKRGERPALTTRLSWLEQAARGLAYAHVNGIVHRDVKPANLRILEDGTVKIMDFGIAKLLENDSGLTRAGATVGTAAYLAPEQLHGEPVDARTDLFAFGVVAYELLAGRRPFAGKQLSAVIYQILHHDPEPLEQLVPDCAPEVAGLVARCLAKDRAQRPASAEVVADELAACIGEILSESAIGRAPVLRPPGSTRPDVGAGAPTPDLATTRLPAQPAPASAEVTSGIRELALDPDAASDSGHLSGTRVLEMRGAPWGTVAAVAGALLVAGLGIAGIVQLIRGPGPSQPQIEAESSPAPVADSPASLVEQPSTSDSADAQAGTTTTTAPAQTPAAAASEPTPAPVAPAPARLSIGASWSADAAVEVAGRRLVLDRTHDLELPAGDYVLQFELNQPYVARAAVPISLSAGDRRAVKPPFGRPGLLTLQPQLGAPQGRISVDGGAAQVGMVRGMLLPPGRHRVRVEPLAAGAAGAIEYEAEILSGQELILTFDLGRQQITPVVKSLSNGAP